MPHTITISATSAGLNQFVQRNSAKIHSLARQELEFEKMFPFVETENTYVGHDIAVADVVQPYQHQFTPKNTETHTGITASLQPIKADLLFTAEQLESFFTKWKANYFHPDPKQIKVRYFDYLLGMQLMPKIMEEVNLASWAGEYSAPVAGTPGAVLDSVDGYAKKLVDHITAGLFTPITTGALVAGTMVTQVRDFCQAIPEPYRYKNGILLMSKTRAQQYSDGYKDDYSGNSAVIEDADGLRLRVDDYNKVIVGITAMEGSDRIICQFDNYDGMQIGTRTGAPRYFNFRFQEFDRTLKVMGEMYRFYDWETPLHTFVNEQV